MLEASASSELLCVATESFIHVLAPPRREAIAEFAVEFSAKLCQAVEAKQPHMTDLSVGMDVDAGSSLMPLPLFSILTHLSRQCRKTALMAFATPLKRFALISKSEGGIGVAISNVRA